jgi:hypothetical protein
LPEDRLLLIEVPLDIQLLPEILKSPPEKQSFTLLAFLGVQADPEIPGVDWPGWRKELEKAF